jgi:hypothetical protein
MAASQSVDDRARRAGRTQVTGGGDHGHVAAGGCLQYRVHAGHLGAGDAVLPSDLPGGADRDDVTLGHAPLQRGDGGGDRGGGVVQRRRWRLRQLMAWHATHDQGILLGTPRSG